MRRRLIVTLSMVLITIALLSSPRPLAPTSSITIAGDNDCAVVRQVCGDMGQMVYNVCITSGCPQFDCANSQTVFRNQCIIDNGCLPNGN